MSRSLATSCCYYLTSAWLINFSVCVWLKVDSQKAFCAFHNLLMLLSFDADLIKLIVMIFNHFSVFPKLTMKNSDLVRRTLHLQTRRHIGALQNSRKRTIFLVHALFTYFNSISRYFQCSITTILNYESHSRSFCRGTGNKIVLYGKNILILATD